jgi:hypothetical protein
MAKAPKVPKPPKDPATFPAGTVVRFKAPPTTLGWGFAYRPGTALAVRSETPGDPLEVTLVRWEDDGSHQLCWTLDLEAVPAAPVGKAAPPNTAPL